jgi:hypothetical protein
MSILTFISRRLRVAGRARHITFVPLKPAGFITWHKSLLKFKSRRPLKWYFRAGYKRVYLFPGTAIPQIMVLQKVWRVYLKR